MEAFKPRLLFNRGHFTDEQADEYVSWVVSRVLSSVNTPLEPLRRVGAERGYWALAVQSHTTVMYNAVIGERKWVPLRDLLTRQKEQAAASPRDNIEQQQWDAKLATLMCRAYVDNAKAHRGTEQVIAVTDSRTGVFFIFALQDKHPFGWQMDPERNRALSAL